MINSPGWLFPIITDVQNSCKWYTLSCLLSFSANHLDFYRKCLTEMMFQRFLINPTNEHPPFMLRKSLLKQFLLYVLNIPVATKLRLTCDHSLNYFKTSETVHPLPFSFSRNITQNTLLGRNARKQYVPHGSMNKRQSSHHNAFFPWNTLCHSEALHHFLYVQVLF